MQVEFTDSEEQFVMDGLHALVKVKQDAFKTVTESEIVGYRFTEEDFGIPQIQALITRLGEIFYGPADESGEESHA